MQQNALEIIYIVLLCQTSEYKSSSILALDICCDLSQWNEEYFVTIWCDVVILHFELNQKLK